MGAADILCHPVAESNSPDGLEGERLPRAARFRVLVGDARPARGRRGLPGAVRAYVGPGAASLLALGAWVERAPIVAPWADVGRPWPLKGEHQGPNWLCCGTVPLLPTASATGLPPARISELPLHGQHGAEAAAAGVSSVPRRIRCPEAPRVRLGLALGCACRGCSSSAVVSGVCGKVRRGTVAEARP